VKPVDLKQHPAYALGRRYEYGTRSYRRLCRLPAAIDYLEAWAGVGWSDAMAYLSRLSESPAGRCRR